MYWKFSQGKGGKKAGGGGGAVFVEKVYVLTTRGDGCFTFLM